MSDPRKLVKSDGPKRSKDTRAQQSESSRSESAGTGGSDSPGHPFPSGRKLQGFEVERATYERIKPTLLERAQGKFFVLVGEEYAGPYDGFNDAEEAGYTRFGIEPLYIKQVLAEEPVVRVSRDLGI